MLAASSSASRLILTLAGLNGPGTLIASVVALLTGTPVSFMLLRRRGSDFPQFEESDALAGPGKLDNASNGRLYADANSFITASA